jgi:hypothetical protein
LVIGKELQSEHVKTMTSFSLASDYVQAREIVTHLSADFQPFQVLNFKFLKSILSMMKQTVRLLA